MQDVALRVQDTLGGVAGSLTLTKLTAGRIAPGVETPVELQAQLDFAQPAVQGELRDNTLVRLAEPATAGAPATLGVTLGESKLAFVGTAGGTRFGRAEIALAGTAYTAESRKLELQKLKLALDVTPPDLAAQSLTLEGTASASPKLLAWDLQGRWRAPGNDGPVSTSGRYALDSGTVTAKAQLQSLDVDALRAGAPQAPAATTSSASASAPAAPAGKTAAAASGDNTPVDLSAAAALKGTVDATLGTLVANGIRFSDMHVVLKGDGRTLDAAPFSAKVWNGQIQGRAQVQPAARRLSLVAEATGIRIEQALKDVSGRDTVQGVGRLELDLTTGGQTVGQLKSHLAGRAALQLRDGAVKGFNLAELGRKAKAALALKKDDFEKASATEKTDFSEISASFAIANGVARSSDLAAKSPYLRVTGEGAIDIPRSAID
ncbi:MAG: AsmA family protein, partial [Variovorax sp.]